MEYIPDPPRGYVEEEEDLPGGRVPGNKADYYYSRPNYGQDPGNDAENRMPRNNSQGSTTGQAPYNQRQSELLQILLNKWID